MHRNLKPENILISPQSQVSQPEYKVVISDFAFSRKIQTPHLHSYTPEDPKEREKSGREARRLFYKAPELMFRPNIYTQEVDMWSVGCILAELVLQEPLFRAGSELELLLRIFSMTGSPDKNLIA